MSDTASSLLPKKPDGTTDWDVVFDDPDKGLIALIGRVTSPDALKQCGQLIIRRLFTRKNDELDVARFNRELDEILTSEAADGDIAVIKAEVILMLQRIKAIRVAKARAFVEGTVKKQKANRRSGSSKAANTYKFINNPKLVAIIITGSVVLGLLLISLIYWLAFSDPSRSPDKPAAYENPQIEAPSDRQKRENAELDEKMKRVKAQQLAEQKRAEEEKRLLQRIMPPALVLPGVFIQREINGVLRNLKPIMPIFVLNKRENLSKLCGLRPKLIDIINVTLSNSISAATTGSTIDYVQTAETIRDRVNELLRSKILTEVKLITDSKSSDLATAGDRCTLATGQYFDYLYSPKTR